MIYIITGTSKGIGKAIAEFYLEKGNKVIGISRQNTIQHPLFTFVPCDLGDLKALEQISFTDIIQPTDFPIRLINNAGIIGDIKRSHLLSLAHYEKVASTNIVAVQYLSSYVLKTFGFNHVDAIITISSGAAQRPIPSWSAYCASKAAIDLFAQTLQQEIIELGENTRIYNLAPGVVDTDMQETIRKSSQEDFSDHTRFVNLKENNELRTPEEVAELLNQFLMNPPDSIDQVVYRL